MRRVIKDAIIVSDFKKFKGSVVINNEIILEVIQGNIDLTKYEGYEITEASEKLLIPGAIDDQVHFREPGLTHKAEIYTESKAAVAGGVTSYMEMPNTNPQTVTHEELAKKNQIAAEKSLANYSFFFGATNSNIEEIKKINPKETCGVKIFMGSSTGNMLVDNQEALARIFKESPVIIATHCEDEETIRNNTEKHKEQYGEDIPIEQHPIIRSREACYKSSSMAMKLARENDARLHILHISTKEELELFDNAPLSPEKKITCEVCTHHLWFEDADYKKHGTRIKWNPAVKSIEDREAIRRAINTDRVDVLATDHAPHTLEEKSNPYLSAPSGGPLVQHSVLAVLDLVDQGVISLEKAIDKLAHKPAQLFQVDKRGHIKPGYYADLVLIDTEKTFTVNKGNIYAKCGWSPFEGHSFQNSISQTYVNGHLAFADGQFYEDKKGKALRFDR